MARVHLVFRQSATQATQPSHKPSGRLSLLSARPAVTFQSKNNFWKQACCLMTQACMCAYDLPKSKTYHSESQTRDLSNLRALKPEALTVTSSRPTILGLLHCINIGLRSRAQPDFNFRGGKVDSSTAKGALVEAPKAPRRVGCGRGWGGVPILAGGGYWLSDLKMEHFGVVFKLDITEETRTQLQEEEAIGPSWLILKNAYVLVMNYYTSVTTRRTSHAA